MACAMAAVMAVSADAGEEASDEVVVLQSSLQQCRALVGPLRDGAKALEAKLKTCGADVKESKQKYDALQEQVKLDMNELEDLRSRARKAMDSFSDKETDVARLERELRELKNNNTKLVQLGKHQRTQNKKLADERDEALALLEYEKSAAKDTVVAKDAALAEIESLKKQVKELMESDTHKSNDNMREEIEGLKSKLENSKSSSEEVQTKYTSTKNALDDARKELKKKSSELDSTKTRLDEISAKLTSVQSAKDRLDVELDEKKALLEKTKSDLETVASEKSDAEDRASELAKKQAAAAEESERLKGEFLKYKEKVDDPALVDYFVKKAEWLKNPKVSGVDRAYEKTMKLLGPKLEPTQEAILEMQSMLQASREKLSSAVGETEDSPILSGMLTYGILLIPFGISMCLLVRLKRCISLTKATMFMSMYNLIFSGLVFATSFFIEGEEPMATFREQNEQAFESLQIMLPIYYAFYMIFVVLLFLKLQVIMRCRCSLRVPLVLVIPIGVMIHYYRSAWVYAMHDKPPQLESVAWAAYAGAFLVHFGLITCCAPSNSSKASDEEDMTLPLVSKSKRAHGHLVAEAQESKDGHIINVSADVMSPEEVSESLTEGAEAVRDKASAIAESFKTGKSVKEIETEQRKSKKKSSSTSKKKKKKAETSDIESLEGSKVD